MLFIFDMGGVVSGNVHVIPAMAERLGIGENDFFAIAGSPETADEGDRYNHGLIARVQSGEIDSREFWRAFAESARTSLGADESARVAQVASRENLWASCFKPRPLRGTVKIIERLKEAGHRVVCGTNTLDAHYAIHLSSGDYRPFDRVYASHEMGVIKPNPAFWEKILAAEASPASEAIFVDDNGINVEAARKLGIESVLFVSSESLAAALGNFFRKPPLEGQAR